jgi:hypothetical protein
MSLSLILVVKRRYAQETDGLRRQSESPSRQQGEPVGGLRGLDGAETGEKAQEESELIMKTLMGAWSDFCDTLNTRGGTIALLFIATAGLFLGVLHVMHHGDSNQAATVIISTFSGFTGALLLALTQKDKTNGNGGSK